MWNKVEEPVFFLIYFSTLISGYGKMVLSKECLVIVTVLGLRGEPDCMPAVTILE